MKEMVCHMCLQPFMAENDITWYCSPLCKGRAKEARRRNRDEQVQERMDAAPPSIDFDALT